MKSLAQLNSPDSAATLASLLTYSSTGKHKEPSALVRLAALEAVYSLNVANRKEVLESFLKHETDPGVYAIAEDMLARRKLSEMPSKDATFDPQSVSYLIKPLELSGSQKFIEENFPRLIKQDYDERITWVDKYYGPMGEGFSDMSLKKVRDAWVGASRYWEDFKQVNGWENVAPGHSIDPVAFLTAKRKDGISSQYLEQFEHLKRLAKGEFDPHETRSSETQEQAITVLAYLVATNGRAKDAKPLLRDSDRSDIVADAARTLSEIARPGHSGRVKAAEYIKSLIVDRDVHYKARLALVPGLRRLAGSPEYAFLTESEAVQIAAKAYYVHINSNLPLRKNAKDERAYRSELDSIRQVENELTTYIVYGQNRRDSIPLLKKRAQETDDSYIKVMSERREARSRGGVAIALQNADNDSNKDQSSTLEERATRITSALKDLEKDPNGDRAVEAIFKGVLGFKPLQKDDPRLQPLLSALQSDNERVQLAAAISLCYIRGNQLSGYPKLGLDKIAELSKYAENEEIKYEADAQLRKMRKEDSDEKKRALRKGDKDLANKWNKQIDSINESENTTEKARQGASRYFIQAQLLASDLTMEQRTESLERLLDGLNDGDPVRVVYKSVLGPEGKGQHLKEAKADDKRLPLLRKLLQSENERIRLAASIVLIRFSPALTDRIEAIKTLAELEASCKSEQIVLEATDQLNLLQKTFEESGNATLQSLANNITQQRQRIQQPKPQAREANAGTQSVK